MNYITEFDLYIDIVFIVYKSFADIIYFLSLMWEDSKGR